MELLESERPVLGIFSGDQTRAQGRRIVEVEEADFILYSLEQAPFDVEGMEAYIEGMREAGGRDVLSRLPVMLRVPPIAEGEGVTTERIERGVEAGASGIVFPHVTTPEEAAFSARALRRLERRRGGDELVDILILEDREAVEAAREIMATPGLEVVFAGPGDLRRAYDGDMEAVEAAIQRVLAACLEFEVACGVTAGADDIGQRLDEGFQVIIVTELEALEAARRWEGEDGGPRAHVRSRRGGSAEASSSSSAGI